MVGDNPETFADLDGHETPPGADHGSPERVCVPAAGQNNICGMVHSSDVTADSTDQEKAQHRAQSANVGLKDLFYGKAEGGVGLGADVKVGPLKFELEVKSTYVTKNSSDGDDKSDVKEIGIKAELGGWKLGLATGTEQKVMENDHPVEGPVERKTTVAYEKGGFKGSNAEMGLEASGCAGPCGGLGGGIRGDKAIQALSNQANRLLNSISSTVTGFMAGSQ